MGEANASIPTVQPVYGRPMWAAQPEGAGLSSFVFTSQASIDKGEQMLITRELPRLDSLLLTGIIASYRLKKRAEGVKKCRAISKRDMKHNNALPKMSGERTRPARATSIR